MLQAFTRKTFTLSRDAETWTGDYVLWYRNPLEAIQSLFSNPMFKNEMVYIPEKHFNRDRRLYSEIHWSDWWWHTQVF